MNSDPIFENRVRLRAYELHKQRAQEAYSALDDWIQAEAELRAQPDETAAKLPREGGWRNIEPLLKWGAVAYGFGFVTVMWHTRELGIPVIQLVEPINVWIGLPLAIVLFFLDKIIASVKGASAELIQEFREAKKQRESMENWRDPQELYSAIISTLDKVLLLYRPTSFWLPRQLLQFARHNLERLFDDLATQEQKRASLLKGWGLILYSLNAIVALQRFASFILYIAFIFAACAVYVSDIYPTLPQSVGGGQPLTVRLIVNTEKIPTDTEHIRDMFPAAPGANGQTNQEKSAETLPVTLHYQTADAYYINRGKGPIVALDHKAVDGVIFSN